MENESQLQIVISAVNEAGEQITEVGEQLSGLGPIAEAAGTAISDSLTPAEDAVVAQAQAAADAWKVAAESIPDDFAAIETPMSEVFDALASANAEAAATVSAAWATQGKAMEADLSAAIADAEPAVVAESEAMGSAAGEGFGGYFKKMIVGYIGEQIGSFLSGGIDSAVQAASKNANQIATLTAQIDQQKASIASNEAALQKWTGTTIEIAAAHEKAAANIDAEKVKITELNQQLATLSQTQQGMTGQVQGIANATLAWIGANEKIETFIQTFMTTLGPLITGLSLLLIGITLIDVAMGILEGPMLIIAGVLLALAVGIAIAYALWVDFHTQIVSFFDDLNTHTGILDLFKQSWQSISADWNDELLPALKQLWDALQPLKPFMEAMGVVIGATLVGAIVLLVDILTLATQGFTDILTIATKVATFFTDVLVVSLNLIEKAIEAIAAAVSKVGSVGGAIGGAISSTLSKIPAFAEGGIVNGPTLALVGEAGPEAIIPLSAFNGGSSLSGAGSYGGGGNIVINIGSLVGTDSQSATRFANQLTKMIQQQLRMHNYA
jgi:hypothetical protein